MKERPILFNGAMVRAILESRKTQTRRLFKPENIEIEPHPKVGLYYHTYARRNGQMEHTGMGPFVPESWLHYCPLGQPGDRIWVRETLTEIDGHICFAADNAQLNPQKSDWCFKRRTVPSIHAPRWASRITLEIVSVRVDRVQEISEEDALAEGCIALGDCECTARHSFQMLWDSVYKNWDANPWVWAIEFKRV